MGYFLLILGIVLIVGAAFLLIKEVRAYLRDKKTNTLSKSLLLRLGLGVLAGALGFASLIGSAAFIGEWKDAGRIVLAILGVFFFALVFVLLWVCFVLRFYRPDIEAKQLKWVKIGLYAAIPLSVIFFLVFGEGVAPFLKYPLVCGFNINGSGFHWLTADNLGSTEVQGGLSVRWYGVIILFGALVCLWITDHRFYQKYGKHGIMDTTFVFAFLGGILGARIWYVVGNWEREGFNADFGKIFRIWDGGLTILGGAVGGILVGMTFVLLRRKWVDIRFPFDVVVPTILLGQAIGRWGNFFNCEVYGGIVDSSSWWFLPTWVANQMNYNAATAVYAGTTYSVGPLPSGLIHVPLFLIESLINIAGYFIIAYGVPAIWKKHRAPGVLMGFYLLWYGVVRIIMEPLRDGNFNMGTDNMWSVWNSMIYIILGVAVIIGFQVADYLLKGKPWCAEPQGDEQEKASASGAPLPTSKPVAVKEEDIVSAPSFEIKESIDPKAEENRDEER